MAEAVIGKIQKPTKPELIYDAEYKHPIVASSYTGHTSLLSNVSGKPWLVEYYRQVHGASTEADGFQPDSIETYQSYEKIKGLIIKLESALANTWDGEWSVVGQEGLGYVIFDLAPVPYDVFLADIGDGRAGLFQLFDEPRIKTVAMDKCYEINVRLVAIVDPLIEENLNKKTVRTLVYSKDAAIRGGNAVLTVGEYDANKELAKLETVLIQDYLAEFYFDPEKTIVLPNVTQADIDNNTIKYDPYLTQFLSYTLTTKKTGLRDPIRCLGVSYGKSKVGGTKLTVWEMFKQFNFRHPERYKQQYYLFQSSDLLNTRYYGGVYYSKIGQVILTEDYGSANSAYARYDGLADNFILFNSYRKDQVRSGTKIDDFFSEAFYTGNPTLPHEKFIFDFFRDNVIDKHALIAVINGYWSLTPMQRCYMGGIYVLAIRVALSSTYRYL